jgi:hypothetical protein
MMIKIKKFVVKSTGETVVTNEVGHPKFWGRLLRQDDKNRYINSGVLTANQTDPDGAPSEEPLEAPGMDEVDYSEGLRAFNFIPDDLIPEPSISVIDQLESKNSILVSSPKVSASSKHRRTGPLIIKKAPLVSSRSKHCPEETPLVCPGSLQEKLDDDGPLEIPSVRD